MSADDGIFVHSYCPQSDWAGSIFTVWTDPRYRRITNACFQDIGLLIPLHFIVLLLAAYRAYTLNNNHSLNTHTACTLLIKNDASIQKVKMVLCLLCSVIPLFQLHAAIFYDAEQTHTGSDVSVPFLEIFALCLASACWGTLLYAYNSELNCQIREGQLVTRVATVFIATVEAFKFASFQFEANKHDDIDVDYFYYLQCLLFWSICAVAGLNICHWATHYRIISNGRGNAHQVCPEWESSWWDLVWFNWMTPLIEQGATRPLEVADIWELDEGDKNMKLDADFQESWVKQVANISPSFYKSMSEIYGFRFYLGGLLRIFSDLSQFVGPLFLGTFIDFIDNPEADATIGYMYSVIMFLSAIVGSWFFAIYYQTVQRVGMRMRSTIYSAIFRKSLFLSHKGRVGVSNGKMVNLMTSDAEALEQVCAYFHALWSSFITIIVCIVMLYNVLGVASILGMLAMFFFLPIQKKIIGKMISLTELVLARADLRTKLVREVLSNINIVKMYAWEDAFDAEIQKVREEELGYQEKRAILQAVAVLIVMSIPVFVSVFSFAIYTMLGNVLDAKDAFTAMTLFNLLRVPLAQLPQAINRTIQAKVSFTRLEELLCREEMEEFPLLPINQNKPSVVIKNGDFSWGSIYAANKHDDEENAANGNNDIATVDTDDINLSRNGDAKSNKGALSKIFGKKNAPKSELRQGLLNSEYEADVNGDVAIFREDSAMSYYGEDGVKASQLRRIDSNNSLQIERDINLHNINIEIQHGELLCVIGVTGSGKTSLLSAILGDMPSVGDLYGADTATPGFECNVQGTMAYVPQQSFIFNATVRGNILFGKPFDEQKYELALETSCLAKDLLLFPNGDQTEIGEKGVNLSGGQKQRISLARAVYAEADVYLFDDPLSALDAHVGRAVFETCIEGLLRKRNATRILVTNQIEFLTECDNIIVMNDGHVVGHGSFKELKDNPTFSAIVASQKNDEEDEEEEETKEVEEVEVKKKVKAKRKKGGLDMGEKAGALIAAEDRELGIVSGEVVKDYIKEFNNRPAVILMIFFFIMAEATRCAAAFWVTTWSDAALGPDYDYTLVYALFSVAQCACILGDQMIFAIVSISAARAFHGKMLGALLRAPMAFFTATPLGRILNRFTKDTLDIDQSIAFQTAIFIQTLLMLLGTMFIISWNTPSTLIVAIPVLVLFFKTYFYYQNTSRELKRLDAISRSPIYAHFSQCLNGIASIRAYRAGHRLCGEYSEKIDVNMKMDLAQFSSQQWLTVRLATMGGFTVLAAALGCVFFRSSLTGSVVGLTLSFSLAVTGVLNICVRTASFAENSFNAVERVKSFMGTEPEAPLIIDHCRPPANWPSLGHVRVNNVTMKYRPDLPPVLHDCSFEIFPGQKLGVVGRTGAGKSSLFACLYRLVELDAGSIMVDNEDISLFGLRDVRSSFAIIPQDPVLFTGTIRSNLDPFSEYTDNRIWDALQRAKLRDFVANMEAGLETSVDEDGCNFSLGQKQLICLARALLRACRIVVLDEATAAVDPQTDALIQETIRSEFKDSTVLTIAHRLNTIMDSDRILVLDAGQIKEFGTPFELLTLPASASSPAKGLRICEERIFLSMVEATGSSKSKHMLRIAEEAYTRTEGDETGEQVTMIKQLADKLEAEDRERAAVFGEPEEEVSVNDIDRKQVLHTESKQALAASGNFRASTGNNDTESLSISEQVLGLIETLAELKDVPAADVPADISQLRTHLQRLLDATEATMHSMGETQ